MQTPGGGPDHDAIRGGLAPHAEIRSTGYDVVTAAGVDGLGRDPGGDHGPPPRQTAQVGPPTGALEPPQLNRILGVHHRYRPSVRRASVWRHNAQVPQASAMAPRATSARGKSRNRVLST